MVLLHCLLVVVTAGTISTVLILRDRAHMIEMLGDRLESIAATAALKIDGDAHARITSHRDVDGTDFAKLSEVVRNCLKANDLPHDAMYTLRPVERGGRKGTEFVVMGGTPYTGDPYVLRPEMGRAMRDRVPTHTSTVYTDEYGTWLSAYAPIVTSDGVVDGVLEVDMPADVLAALLAENTRETLLYTFICMLLAIFLGAVSVRWLLRPMGVLNTGIQQLRAGNYEHRIDTALAAPELGAIASTFNLMAGELEASRRVMEASERRYKTLSGSVAEAVLVVRESDRRLVEVNAAAEEMLGQPASELLGVGLEEVLAFVESDGATSLLNEGQPRRPTANARLRRAGDEAPREIEAQAARVVLDAEPAWLVTCRDMTEHRQEWARLIQASKLAAIGEMAGGLAHQINNPLVGVLNFAQLLRRNLPADDPNHELAATIEEAAQRCRETVRALLRFGRHDTGAGRELDLEQVVTEALTLSPLARDERADPELWQDGRGSRLRLRQEGEPSPVWGDPGQLVQVIVNLLNNARQASPEGDLEIVVRNEVDVVTVDVRDAGPGVPPCDRDRVFDPFFTTKPEGEGTGLGLSVAYGIAKEHGGDLVLVESGQGAVFRLTLPVYQGPGEGQADRGAASGRP
jgi:PAS domain S-box-containing protein